jgi:hypothetical protein
MIYEAVVVGAPPVDFFIFGFFHHISRNELGQNFFQI